MKVTQSTKESKNRMYKDEFSDFVRSKLDAEMGIELSRNQAWKLISLVLNSCMDVATSRSVLLAGIGTFYVSISSKLKEAKMKFKPSNRVIQCINTEDSCIYDSSRRKTGGKTKQIDEILNEKVEATTSIEDILHVPECVNTEVAPVTPIEPIETQEEVTLETLKPQEEEKEIILSDDFDDLDDLI